MKSFNLGSVGCYSKKVDYLHQYSMKTLNMIGKDGGGDGTGDGDPADGEGGGKNEFMCHKY